MGSEPWWFLELKTAGSRRSFSNRLNREIFRKTLKLVEAIGWMKVMSCVMTCDRVRLVIASTRRGSILFDELRSISERVMQLACRTDRESFWGKHGICRRIDGIHEAAPLPEESGYLVSNSVWDSFI